MEEVKKEAIEEEESILEIVFAGFIVYLAESLIKILPEDESTFSDDNFFDWYDEMSEFAIGINQLIRENAVKDSSCTVSEKFKYMLKEILETAPLMIMSLILPVLMEFIEATGINLSTLCDV